MTTNPLSARVRGLQLSPTVAINEACDRLRAEGRQIYKLGLGQSPFPVPPVVVEALRHNATRKAYLPVRGLPELRSAVAGYHRRVSGSATVEEDLLIGPGSKELMFVLQHAYDGEIVIPTPAWVSYAPQAQIVGRNVRYVHTRAENDFRLTPDELAAVCLEGARRHRILILNYPSNPTGATYSAEQLAALAVVARAHEVVVLSDEIYGELHHRGAHVSMARFYPEGTIISSGLSKWCGAGGWRLGTFAFPSAMRWLLDAMAAIASETYTSTSAPIQYAAVRAFEGGIEIERYLRNTRRILSALAAVLCERLRSAGLRVTPPVGGFYLFVDFSPLADGLGRRGIQDDRAICAALLGEGVAILPGSGFGRDPAERTARIAYVDFDGARALAASEALPADQPVDRAFLRAYCGDVVDAVDRIVAWASKDH